MRLLAALTCSILLLPCGVFARTVEPPPLELRSLAEELAPLIKNNPELPRKSKNTTAVKTLKKKNETPLTAVEESFSKRAGETLHLFGYQQIGRQLNENPPETGEVQEDMIVGAGDVLLVTFRGQRDDSRTYRITAQGELIVKGLNPIAASGLTLGALQNLIEAEASKHLLNTTVFVSMKELRQIGVTVMGEVKHPGTFTLSPFQTVLDALAMTKGVTPNGSLRNIHLIRAGKTATLDFYQLLLRGELNASIHLRDGDKIIVPVIGQTVAVGGDVKRPGIFERNADGNDLNTTQLLELAGGVVRPGANRFVKLSLTPYGEEKVDDLLPGQNISFRDGDMLIVTSGPPLRTNGIQLSGHVRQSGARSLSKAPSLRALLSYPGVFLEGVYPLMGIIARQNPKTLAKNYIAFSPARILQGQDDVKLAERDNVMIFGMDDIRRVLSDKPKKPKTIDELLNARANDKKTQQRDASPIPFADETKIENDDDNPLLTEDVIRFLRDHAATVHGTVMNPGLYPIAGKTPLDAVISVAGGLRADAANSQVEIILANPTRDGHRYTVDLKKDIPETILIAANDKVSVGKVQNVADIRPVEIFGDVKRPGFYDLRKGDTLLDLIERAGGMNDTAYPKGAIFMRESERRRQLDQFRRVARELDLAIANYYMKDDDAQKNADKITAVQKIADDMRHADAAGRITVEADPSILRAKPELAVLLQAGDRIFVPRRPSTVSVMGEVLSPSALQFIQGKSGNDYIRQAGGMTRYADDDRAFVVYPDGSAAPLGDWIQGNIPVGSTIIVPRDPKPFDFLEVAGSIGNILAQMAVTAVAINNLQNTTGDDVYYYP